MATTASIRPARRRTRTRSGPARSRRTTPVSATPTRSRRGRPDRARCRSWSTRPVAPRSPARTWESRRGYDGHRYTRDRPRSARPVHRPPGGLLMPEPNLELGRFADHSLLILVSLSEGPKHGYAIMTDVEAGTGRPLGPGTLYAALARLEERALIEALEPVDRRRPYRLTGVGATVLKDQLAHLESFARLGLRRL